MKTRPLSTAARMIGFTSLLVLVLALAYASTRANGVIPTNEWVNFHSFNTIFAGQPVPVGAYVAAYDADGVQCGEFIVVEAGKYGVMPVYRDDDTTLAVDEGAEPGDLITFTINGWSAVALGPDDPIWTSHGDLLEVDLDVAAAQRGKIIVEKQTDPDGAGGTFTFTGDAAGTIGDGEQIVVSNLQPGTYTSTETAPSGWDLTDITCSDGNSTGNVGTRVATINLEAGETVTCTFTNTFPNVETATGTGIVTFESGKGTIEDLAAVAEGTLPAEGKPDLDFPHGFFSFNITGLTPCATVVITITLPSNVPVGTEYWKYHASEGGWIQIPMGSDDGDNVITITLVDGGLGDDDGECNGVIVDPGGPGQLPPKTLTVNKAGGGTGTVTSDPAGIFCGGDCTEDYVKNRVVTLTAHPGVKSYFIEWSGDCSGTGLTTQVTMDSDKICTATFGYPIGGIVVPVNKLELLAPWLGLAALAALAGLTVALVRRCRT